MIFQSKTSEGIQLRTFQQNFILKSNESCDIEKDMVTDYEAFLKKDWFVLSTEIMKTLLAFEVLYGKKKINKKYLIKDYPEKWIQYFHRKYNGKVKVFIDYEMISEFVEKYCVPFIKACKENNQRSIYAYGLILVSLINNDKHDFRSFFREFPHNLGVTMKRIILVHGISAKEQEKTGEWKRGHVGYSYVIKEEYIKTIINIFRKGLRPSGYDQFFSTINHRAVFFYNRKDLSDSEYGPVNVIIDTNAQYTIFNMSFGNQFKEHMIFIPLNQYLKVPVVQVSIYDSIERQLLIKSKDFAEELKKHLKPEEFKKVLFTVDGLMDSYEGHIKYKQIKSEYKGNGNLI